MLLQWPGSCWSNCPDRRCQQSMVTPAGDGAHGRSTSMYGWQSGYVEANGIRLHYTRAGATRGGSAAKASLVLAHGVTDDGLCWTPVARALEAEYDVIM